MSTASLKLKLIEKIVSFQDHEQLQKLNLLVEELSKSDNLDKILKLAKPMKAKLDIEALKKEQNFQPINKEEFFGLFEALAVEENVDELIEII